MLVDFYRYIVSPYFCSGDAYRLSSTAIGISPSSYAHILSHPLSSSGSSATADKYYLSLDLHKEGAREVLGDD